MLAWPFTVKPALRLKQGSGQPWGLGVSLTAWEKTGHLCSQMRPRLRQSGDLGARGCWAQQQVHLASELTLHGAQPSAEGLPATSLLTSTRLSPGP